MSFSDIFYLQLWWPSCSAEWNHFDRGHYKEIYVKFFEFGPVVQEMSFKIFLN